MKHIKPYQIFENNQEPEHPGFPTTEEEINRLCKKYEIANYTINDDLSIDVNGNVDLSNFRLTYLPLNFNYVSGSFFCRFNKLTFLKGSPEKVGGEFNCYNNKLTTLKGGPHIVGSDFNCSNNKLLSLEGSPNKVNGYFNCCENELISLKGGPHIVGSTYNCYDNKLTTLEGSPIEVGAGFYCSDNKLTTLKGAPNTLNHVFDCENNTLLSLEYLPKGINYTNKYTSFEENPIYTLINAFIESDNAEDLVQEFNEYDIVRGDKVVLDRLKVFISDFDLEMPNLDEVKEYYTIV